MQKDVQKGFLFALGTILCGTTINIIKNSVMKWGAKDKEFMEYEKEHNPKLYEKLKDYE